MQMMRGLVFGAVSVIPALFAGLFAYILMGGETEFPEWEAWMYGPCYGVPFLIISASFLFGIRDEEDVE
ncbi:MAG TPA: hypothetical protein QGF70_02730 [Candidatus Thalassarchaeaceae archaeon]|jgi:hypothetical protein|nr:hypothetical protein [Candidatus Thalassarchaeaceae archaeon]HJO41929.1 hypothetical protein [Candidatus Thalassarchaeaceae archaeon]|tara:strand:+ start:90 stop:296 length:207 start_codon:yes stop_codon:yes gene_type:complete